VFCRWIIILLIAGSSFVVAQEKEVPYSIKTSKGWDRKHNPLGDIFPDTFVHRKNNQITLNVIYFLDNKSGAPVDKKNKISEEFLKGRRNMNELMGIKDWKITQQKIENKSGATLIDLSGEYTNGQSEKVKFRERQIFKGTTHIIGTLAYPAGLINGAAKEGESSVDSLELKTVKK